MPISDEKQLIFIHIPKNAGTSIEKNLHMRATGHKPWFIYKQDFPKEWETYKKFAIVRDPIDRFISCYDYARMDKSYWHDSDPKSGSIYGKHPDYDACKKFDINQFVRAFAINANHLKHDGWKPQWYWIAEMRYGMLSNLGPEIKINTIIKYENLSSELVSNNIFETQLPVVNKSDRQNNESVLDSKSIELLKNFYREDYKLFYPEKL